MESGRILDFASLQKIGSEAWLDIICPGMMLRFKLTVDELDNLIEVCQQVRKDFEESPGHQTGVEKEIEDGT
jgi:hypothetical protein